MRLLEGIMPSMTSRFKTNFSSREKKSAMITELPRRVVQKMSSQLHHLSQDEAELKPDQSAEVKSLTLQTPTMCGRPEQTLAQVQFRLHLLLSRADQLLFVLLKTRGL
jgi:hypothetical protein